MEVRSRNYMEGEQKENMSENLETAGEIIYQEQNEKQLKIKKETIHTVNKK